MRKIENDKVETAELSLRERRKRIEWLWGYSDGKGSWLVVERIVGIQTLAHMANVAGLAGFDGINCRLVRDVWRMSAWEKMKQQRLIVELYEQSA
ncbi:hypothetical protein PV325_001856 [Microctonus aethiopoides]|nr:hypothetical protein PV325_001856 [Microctonus aethiopoides]